jgi:hypothetical protein
MAGSEQAVMSERVPDSAAPRRAAAPEQQTGAATAGTAPTTALRATAPPPDAASLGARQIRAKSVVGASTDPAEREADHAADKALRMAAPEQERPIAVDPTVTDATSMGPGAATSIPVEIQRSPAALAAAPQPSPAPTVPGPVAEAAAAPMPAPAPMVAPAGSATPATRIRSQAVDNHDPHGEHMLPAETERYLDQSQGTGSPLSDGTRRYFEARFSTDFGPVRVHDDDAAGQAAKSIGAQAFTRGRDIWFSPGAYDPATDGGRRLLAHELAHISQQNPGIGCLVAGARGRSAAGPTSAAGSPGRAVGRHRTGGKSSISVQGSAVDAEAPQLVQRQDTPSEGESGLDERASRFNAGGKFGGGHAAERILGLQQQGGNQAASTMLASGRAAPVQRWTNPLITFKSDDELIRDGLAGDLNAISQIRSFDAVKADDRFRMLDLLIHQDGWVGPRNKKAIVELWGAWGADGLADAVASHPALWRDCADNPGLFADVRDLPGIRRLEAALVTDVQSTAINHLDANDTAVRQQMAHLGIPANDGAALPPLTAEQRAEFERMRVAAKSIAEMQRKQAAAREVYVGWNHATVDGVVIALPMTFSPFERPPDPFPMGQIGPNPPMHDYDTVKTAYDGVTDAMGQELARFPALYAVSRDGDPAKTEAFATMVGPEQMRITLSASLRALLSDIAVTKKAIAGAQIDALDLSPVVQQLHSGAVPAATDWKQPLPQWTLEDASRQHAMSKALADLGFASAGLLAGLLAPFTGGGSVLIFAGIAAAETLKAVGNWRDYEQLSTASRTAALPGTGVVGDDAVDDARARAVQATVTAAMAALTAVLAGVGVVAASLFKANPEADIILLIEDSNREFPLTRVNAVRILEGPEGSTAVVAGPGGEGPDVVFRAGGPDGPAVLSREVKCIAGSAQGSFNREVSHAASQISYSGEVYVQVPEGSDGLRMVNRFRGARDPAALSRYGSVRLVIVTPGGATLFEGTLAP